MTAPRTTFDTPRAAEFLERRALQAQTGRPVEQFGEVVVKELVDNALDAAETAGTQPEVELQVTEPAAGLRRVTVADNGPGISVEVVERILNFAVLVSDKAAYRSPTRGLQGNAFKTLLGMPHALDVSAPVVIEAMGVRHEIAVTLDPGGNVVIRHDRAASTHTAGTAVTVPLPATLAVDPDRWLERFALVNPHATFGMLADDAGSAVSYKPSVADAWTKPLPTDPTSPHWYDTAALKRLVFAHIAAARVGARDIPLGEFIRTFDGLTSTAKARTVKAAVPGIDRLSDFGNRPDDVGWLLKAMKAEAKPYNTARLGQVGEDHVRARFTEAFGVERFWYRKKAIDHHGVGWMLEVAVAETEQPGRVYFATNYSPSFGDPLGMTLLRADDVTVRGASSFLSTSDAEPDQWRNEGLRAAFVHVVCAAPEFTDKGKVALTVPEVVAEQFAATIAAATRVLHRERKRAQRDARAARAAADRDRRQRQPDRVTLKDAVFAVMEDAIEHTSDGGTLPFPTRNLLYAVRPRIQQFTDAELKMNYFGQTLVVEWEREHGPIPGHYRDPRGELREPHTGKSVRLGTREVAEYILPPHVFDKILYIEKEGLNPIFAAAKIAERFDVAIASGKGQPVEAVRDLFARAGAGRYRLFVLHDADHSGYVIRRVIAEETARMPNHRVEVVDLGLSVADAILRNLPTERYTRKVELPWWMPDRLDEPEREWFEGRTIGRKQWECTRVELNALGSAGLIDLVESGLREHRATNKVIPPPNVITADARIAVREVVREVAEGVFVDLGLDVTAVTNAIAPIYTDRSKLVRLRQSLLSRRLRRNAPRPWPIEVSREVRRRIDRSDVETRVRRLIAERLEELDDRTPDGAP